MDREARQITIFDIMLGHDEPSDLTPAEEYFIETGRTTYWQDSQGKPYRWWRRGATI